MAQVTFDQTDVFDSNVGNSTPVGYEVNDRTYRECPLLEDVKTGQLLRQTANGWRLTHPGETADGISLMFGKTGKVGHAIGINGEMDGVLNLTPGTRLYPSATVNGGLQTDAVAGLLCQVKVIRPGRIRFFFGTSYGG